MNEKEYCLTTEELLNRLFGLSRQIEINNCIYSPEINEDDRYFFVRLSGDLDEQSGESSARILVISNLLELFSKARFSMGNFTQKNSLNYIELLRGADVVGTVSFRLK